MRKSGMSKRIAQTSAPVLQRFSWRRSGARRRIRTTDTRIFNPLLYQLSYPGIL
jgi:hypothetical protein